MNHVSFDSPEICPNCGSHNWKIKGMIYKEVINFTQITLQCVRCRTTVHAKNAHTNNDQLATNPIVTSELRRIFTF